MEKNWLKHYPKEVPANIDVEQYSSLVSLMEDSFKKYRDLPAYRFMGKVITYGEVADLSSAMAAYLQTLGLDKGDRIAIRRRHIADDQRLHDAEDDAAEHRAAEIADAAEDRCGERLLARNDAGFHERRSNRAT